MDRDMTSYINMIQITKGIGLNNIQVKEAHDTFNKSVHLLKIGVTKIDLITFIVGVLIVDGTFTETYLFQLMVESTKNIKPGSINAAKKMDGTFTETYLFQLILESTKDIKPGSIKAAKKMNRQFIRDLANEVGKGLSCNRLPIIREYCNSMKSIMR